MKVRKSILFAVLGLLLCGFARGAAAPGQGAEGGRRGRGQRTPEERRQAMEDMRRRMSERIRESLRATPEEWKLIEPRLTAVQDAQRDMRGGRGGMFGMMARGRRGPGGQDRPRRPDAEPQSELAQKAMALRDVLDKEDAKVPEIKTALTALRAARKKADEKVKKAQASLREVLSVRQEAVLVTMGMLD